MDDEWVVATTTVTVHEAELVKMHLEAAGLKVFVADAGIVGAQPFLANAVGAVKVKVLSSQLEAAEQILDELEDQPADEDSCLSCGKKIPADAELCPACGWSWASSG